MLEGAGADWRRLAGTDAPRGGVSEWLMETVLKTVGADEAPVGSNPTPSAG